MGTTLPVSGAALRCHPAAGWLYGKVSGRAGSSMMNASFEQDCGERESNWAGISAVLCVCRCSDNGVQVVTLSCQTHCPVYVQRFGAGYDDVSGEASRPAALAAELPAL